MIRSTASRISTTPLPPDALGRTDKLWRDAAPAAGDVALAELPTPSALLDVAVARTNIQRMRDWTAQLNIEIAPHGKTSMCPWLWQEQLDGGSWAITVSTEAQLRVAIDAAVPRIVVANQLVSASAMALIADASAADPQLQIIVWVDSLAGIAQMCAGLRAAAAPRPLDVCLEYGVPGRRTGARDHAAVRELAAAVVATGELRLVGLAAYEGVLGYAGAAPSSAEEVGAEIVSYLDTALALFAELLPLFQTEQPILTAGGSKHFDAVADLEPRLRALAPGARVVIRSGGYVVSDFPRPGTTPGQRGTGPLFTPATRVIARVISRPEPTRVLLDAGRRDVPYDAQLPILLHAFRGREAVELGETRIDELNDQHAKDTVAPDCALEVGDLVVLGTTHACTFFDKWRSIYVVDGLDAPTTRILGITETFF